MRIVFLLPDGREHPAPPPGTLSLRRDADTPADSLELTFSEALSLPGEPCAMRLERDGRTLFTGIVDEHGTDVRAGAAEEFFSLRSRAAVLLDCEAMPQTIRMPSLRLMEKLFLKPFGLRAQGDFTPKAGELVIEKGTSCWSALCTFAAEFLKTKPRFTGGVLRLAPGAPKAVPLREILETRRILTPYARVSRVIVQNARTGAYSAVYENTAAKGIDRVRYLSSYAKTAPETLIAQGERASVRVRVTCGCLIDAEPGDTALFPELGAACGRMRLTSLRYRLADGGEETQLEFEPAEI